jgi:hypothetical protein
MIDPAIDPSRRIYMRQLLLCAAGLALLVGCADPGGLPTDQGTETHAGPPKFDRAQVIRTDVGVLISEPGNPLLVMMGFATGVTLSDFCSGNRSNSPNSIAHVVIPPGWPPDAFLAASHGQDVPVLVYEFQGDICDGVGESLIASGTGRFHFSDKHLRNGRSIGNFGAQATVDLVAGGQARLVVTGPFYVLPGGFVKLDKTRVRLTPL